MAEQPAKSPREPAGGFVARLVPDPASPPDLKLLVGYPGDAAEKGNVRLYASPDLSAWWDIPESDVAQRQPLSGDPLGAEILWVRSEAQPTYQQRRTDSVSNDTAYPTIPPVTLFCPHPTVHTYPTIPPVTLHYCTYAAAAPHTYPVTLHYCTYAAAAPTAHCTWAGAAATPNCGTSPVAGAAGTYPPTSPVGQAQPLPFTFLPHCFPTGPVQTPQAQGHPVNSHWPQCPTPAGQGQAQIPPTTLQTWVQPPTHICTTSPVGQQAQAVYPTQICTIPPHTIGFTCTYVPPCR